MADLRRPSTRDALAALLAYYGYRYRWENPQFVSDLQHLLASHSDHEVTR